MDGMDNHGEALTRACVAWLAGVILFLAGDFVTGPSLYNVLAVALLAVSLCVWYAWAMSTHCGRLTAACREIADAAREVVDPWAMQKELMLASGQRIPAAPRLHNGVVLYAALQMEELGETLLALSDALAHGLPASAQRGVALVASEFYMKSVTLKESAEHVRAQLGSLQIDMPMRESDAVELFDGTTDVAVVNCGFALSCGFPGGAGYLEAGNSNLSKRNPDTGVIDRDASGKWIKGRDYFKPDLARVLARSRA